MNGLRGRLEGNPILQVAIVGVLAIAMAMLMITRLAGGGAGTATTRVAEPITPVPETSMRAPAARSSPARRPAGETGLVAQAGPRLPSDIARHFAQGRAVVLLVSQSDGVEDRAVEAAVRALRDQRNRVGVIEVDISKIGRYAEVTRGAGVSRTPAMVVIKPARLSGGVPTASVRHGFLSAESVAQAVDDAFYRGDPIPSYPE